MIGLHATSAQSRARSTTRHSVRHGAPSTNTAIFNLTRHPAVTVPCGVSSIGTPIGLQIASAHSRDDLILAAAEAFERQDPLAFPHL